jgi:hypothetical protein
MAILGSKALKWAPYHNPGVRLHDFSKISKKIGFLLFWTPKVARPRDFIGCLEGPNNSASFGWATIFKKGVPQKVIAVLKF